MSLVVRNAAAEAVGLPTNHTEEAIGCLLFLEAKHDWAVRSWAARVALVMPVVIHYYIVFILVEEVAKGKALVLLKNCLANVSTHLVRRNRKSTLGQRTYNRKVSGHDLREMNKKLRNLLGLWNLAPTLSVK